MTARFIVADVFDGLAQLEDESVDLVITSPPFLALRSYLPADHPDKGKEIGSEATPAEFLDTLLLVTAELRRVLAPHGSIAVELGDTYSGSTMTGGDDAGNERYPAGRSQAQHNGADRRNKDGWPLAKSVCMIPEAYRFALAYGFNPFTGHPSPAGKWRVRNKVTWCRPNPPVGALGDKWRPATSDVVVACVSPKRYWDDLATRRPFLHAEQNQRNIARGGPTNGTKGPNLARGDLGAGNFGSTTSGAPLLDYWEIPPGGYSGSHYAVFPPELVVPLVKAMCPEKVCLTCGEPARRITETTGYERNGHAVDDLDPWPWGGNETGRRGDRKSNDGGITAQVESLGWTDCGHDNYRPGIVLDPFAGSGTTLAVATGHGLDAIGIDIDQRNAELTTERVGPFLMEQIH